MRHPDRISVTGGLSLPRGGVLACTCAGVFAAPYAFVAQLEEQRSPKPQDRGSKPCESAMKNTVYIIGQTSNSTLQAIADGAKAVGYRVIFLNRKYFDWRHDIKENAAFAVVYGYKKISREIVEAYRAASISCLVVDAGYFLRPDYDQISLNGLNWLPACVSMDAHDRAVRLGQEAKARRKKGDYVLILGQVDGDAQHSIPDCESWIQDAAQKNAGNPVVIRRHPKVELSDISLAEAVADATKVVTYNSTAAIEAIRQGVPVECDESAFYAEYATADKQKRQEFFDRACQAVWNQDEMRSGEAIRTVLQNACIMYREGGPQ